MTDTWPIGEILDDVLDAIRPARVGSWGDDNLRSHQRIAARFATYANGREQVVRWVAANRAQLEGNGGADEPADDDD